MVVRRSQRSANGATPHIQTHDVRAKREHCAEVDVRRDAEVNGVTPREVMLFEGGYCNHRRVERAKPRGDQQVVGHRGDPRGRLPLRVKRGQRRDGGEPFVSNECTAQVPFRTFADFPHSSAE